MNPGRRDRAASGVMALIFISLVAVLFLAAVIQYTNAIYTAQQLQEERANKIRESIELSRAITAVWNYDPLTSTFTLNITNNHAEPVYIPAAVIIYPDKSYQIWRLDHLLSPGETHSHSMNTPPPSVVKIAAVGTKGAAGSAIAQNITSNGTSGAGPSWTHATSLSGPVITNGASTWYGNATHTILSNRTSNVVSVTVLNGTHVTGIPSDIQYGDGLSIVIESEAVSVPPQIILVENNTLVWDNFTSNPLTSGRIVPLDPTVWSYDAIQHRLVKNRPSSTGLPSNNGFDVAYVNLTAYYGHTVSLPGNYYVVTKINNTGTQSINQWFPSCDSGTLVPSLFYGVYLFEGTNNTASAPLNYYQLGQCVTWWNGFRGYLVIRAGADVLGLSILNISGPYSQIRKDTTFLVLFAKYDSTTGEINATIRKYTWFSSNIDAQNTTFNPSYIGIGTSGYVFSNSDNKYYFANGVFDYIYIVKNRDPQLVYVKAPPGHTVRLYKTGYASSFSQSSTYIPSLQGYVLDIYRSPNTGNSFEPVFDGRIELWSGSTLVATYSGTIMGGSVYQYVPGVLHVARVEINTSNTITGPVSLKKVYPVANIMSNTSSTNIEEWIYRYTAPAGYVLSHSSTGSLGNSSAVFPASDYTDSSNANQTRILVNATDTNPFRLQIDLANTIISTETLETYDTLIVAEDGSVRVYRVDSSTTPPTIQYKYAISASPLNDIGRTGGVTVINSTLLGRSVVFVSQNTSGYDTYFAVLGPHTAPMSSTSVGIAGLIVETIRDTSLPTAPERVLILSPGSTSTEYWVIDEQGNVLDNGVLNGLTIWNGYYASDYDGSNTFVLFYNVSSGSLDLVRVVYQSLGIPPVQVVGVVEGLGFTNPVGMAVDNNGDILVMLEGGPLIRIDLPGGTVAPISASLPFIPLNPGDRLEVVGGRPLFIRAYGSNDVWIYT